MEPTRMWLRCPQCKEEMDAPCLKDSDEYKGTITELWRCPNCRCEISLEYCKFDGKQDAENEEEKEE